MKNRIFSTDSAKASKATAYGYFNAIQYLAPASTSGHNLCPHASAACIAACLGWFSGQAGMVADLEKDLNSVRRSRIEKAKRFMRERKAYMHDVAIVFDSLPASYWGFDVIDGDLHDLRHLDPRGVIVGLVPKGAKAKKSQDGFVIRLAA
jgi:hypothetical protein